MNFLVWMAMIIIFLYTIGFSFELWKNQNKVGAVAVFVLALFTVIMPFISVLS